MYSNERKINKIFQYWLFASLILVFSIIIVGGLTRLTDSGLSITEWELFKGLLPPLSENSWIEYFEEYKKIPQYQLLNSNMTINEFKVIFYWEYFHRILARFIGLFFLLPLIYFYFSKKIRSDYINICFLISLLIVLQGVIGWFMVKSGLVNNTSVSHYRLSVHLITAIIIISSIYWLIMNIKTKQNKIFFKFTNQNLPFQILILLILFQIIMGAFVSGLDAGRLYQTWPLMGQSYFPDDIAKTSYFNLIDFENHSIVQFYHRNLAYFITLYVIALCLYAVRLNVKNIKISIIFLIIFLILQIILGIFTLISGLNIYLASAHQITSVLLIFSSLNLYFNYIK